MNDTCDKCNRQAVTQVTHGMAFGLYCREHGAEAEEARQELLRRARRKQMERLLRH